ncbi:GPRHIS [Trypoxylus dichotomus]
MALDQHWFITVALIISSLIAVTANALLLLVFFRRRGLRTISNRFVINLLITNLLSSVFLVPLLIIDQENPDVTLSSTTPTVFENISTELSVDSSTDLLFEGIVSEETGGLKEEKITIRNGIDALEIDVSSNRTTLPSEPLSRTRTNDVLCFFAQSVTNLICTASIFSILLIGIDQYFAVVHPLRYHFYIDKYRSTALIGSCWIFSIAIATIDVLISTDCDFWRFCSRRVDEVDEIRASLRIAFSFVYFFVVIVTPFITICAIYVCIYAAAHENSERMRKSTSTNNTATPNSYSQLPLKGHESSDDSPNDDHKQVSAAIPKVHSAPNFINLVEMAEEKEPVREAPPVRVARSSSDRISHKNLIISLKCRISNASVFRYREETRAAKISLLVIFMVLVCYAPYGLAVLLNTDLYKPKLPRFFNYVSLMLLVISDTISPFLFAYRSRRVQRELLKFLRVLPPKTSGNPDSPKHQQFPRSAEDDDAAPKRKEEDEDDAVAREEAEIAEPFIAAGNFQIPKVVVTCKVENEKKSILKRVCSKNWTNYKKCNFITVPDSCLDARGSFSSASTQISSEE